MKQVIILILYMSFMSLCNIACSAQALAANFTPQSAKSPNSSDPKHLAALVIQSVDNKFSLGLHVESYVEGKIVIKLRSSTTLLHKEVVEGKTYARKYDMFNLPVGDYQIEVENNKEVYMQKITIRVNNGVRVLKLI
jgi:hypothetical protein